jgi:hypothetical protein
MTAIWLASWGVQSITGRVAYKAEQFEHQQAAVSWLQYVGTSDFWNRTSCRPWGRFELLGRLVHL